LRALIQSRIPYHQLNPFIKEKIAPLVNEAKYSQLLQQPQHSLVQPELAKVCEAIGEDIQNMIYRNILLNAISSLWIEHLTHMEGLRVSIGMEAYAQRDPLVQYKSQASDAFKNLLDNIRMTVIGQMFRTRPSRAKPASTKSPSQESREPSSPAPFQQGKNKFKKHRRH
jgi:preprotein translocase subunit SecA